MMQEAFKDLLRDVILDLIAVLEKKSFVSKAHAQERDPVEEEAIQNWELVNECILPEDLRQFYSTMNGLNVYWCVELHEDTTSKREFPVGLLAVNKIEHLTLIKAHSTSGLTLKDLDDEDYSFDSENRRIPTFNDKSFVLSSYQGNVCLVYKKTVARGGVYSPPEVWFIDRSFRFHFLSPTFRQYMRMMVVHLGIKGWEYMFTDIGPSPDTKHWFNFLLPQRMRTLPEHVTPKMELNQVDFHTLFKLKNHEKSRSEKLAPAKNKTNKSAKSRTR